MDIVTNDIDFNDDRRIYILTGPNRGGKTTITQAVGLAFLLAQNGIYVPATQMKFSPCDSKIESLVTGVENGQRSFKVFIAPPQGVSYAKDIAEKYGVTFDKIKKQIDRQRVAAPGSGR